MDPRALPTVNDELRAGRWTVHPRFVLRMAGFAIVGVENLAMPNTFAAARAVVELQLAEAAARERLRTVLATLRCQDLDRDGARHLGEATRELAAGKKLTPERAAGLSRFVDAALVADLAAIATRLDQAEQLADQQLSTELAAAHATLRAAAADPLYQEAVHLSSPQALRNSIYGLLKTGDDKRTGKTRERERVATAYLQRFCAKNETSSFFGPTAAGSFAPTEGLSCDFAVALGERRVYVSHWAASALAASVIADVPELDRVTRAPSLYIDDGVANFARYVDGHDAAGTVSRVYARAKLATTHLRVIELADGTRDVAAIAETTVQEQELEIADVVELIDEMVAAGMFRRGMSVPSGHMDALGYLTETLAAMPETEAVTRWRAELERMRALVARYTTEPDPARRELLTELEQHFAALTATTAHRAAGEHYGDRAIVSEEFAAGARDVRIDSGVMAEAGPAFGLLFDMVSLPTLARRWAAREVFRRAFGAGPVRFVEVERRLADDQAAIETLCEQAPAAQSIKRVREHIGDAIEKADRGNVALSMEALTNAIDPAHLVDGLVAHYSADLVPFNDAGRLRFVVGETHALFWLQEFLYWHLPEREEMIRGRTELLREMLGGRPAAEVVFKHTSKVDLRPPSVLDYELVVDGSSQLSRERTLAIADVTVTLEGDSFAFRAPGVGEFVPIAVGALPIAFQLLPAIYPSFWKDGRYFPEELFSSAGRPAIPRLELGPLVVRRRSWTTTAGEIRDLLGDTPGLVGAARLEQSGWPAQVFYRVAGQPKPMLLDLRSRHLLDLFSHHLGERDAVVNVSEMLPGYDQLALRGPDGMRTCELRMCTWRRVG